MMLLESIPLTLGFNFYYQYREKTESPACNFVSNFTKVRIKQI